MKRPTKNFSCVNRGTKISEGRKKYPCRMTSSKRVMTPTMTIPKGENNRTLPNLYSFLNMSVVYQKTSLTTNIKLDRVLVKYKMLFGKEACGEQNRNNGCKDQTRTPNHEWARCKMQNRARGTRTYPQSQRSSHGGFHHQGTAAKQFRRGILVKSRRFFPQLFWIAQPRSVILPKVSP